MNKYTSRQAVRLNEISICLLKCSPTAENCLPGRGQHHCDIIALRYHGNMPKCLDARGTTGMSTRRSSRYIHGDAVAAGTSNKIRVREEERRTNRTDRQKHIYPLVMFERRRPLLWMEHSGF